MIGIDVTRDVAIRVLRDMDNELIDYIRNARASGDIPTRPGAYAHWVDKYEEQLAVLAAVLDLVMVLPKNTVLSKGEHGSGARRQ